MRRSLPLLLLTLLAPWAQADTGEAYGRGTVGLGHLLLRLQSTARVLHTGAHPDDEDTALLATLARGYGARVVYYSLNRGEGGQNSLGPEQDEALGVLRTEELLAARRVDGAEQWFGLTHDFGFSRSAEETLAKWGEAAVLGDLVEAIRRLRPQVVISRFSGTPADGHGHHQACGQLTRRACEIAGDPAAYPEQLAAGLLPWAPAKLFLDTYQQDQPGTVLPLGDHAPLYGRSFAHLALESRSLHRSQDMGRLEPRGPFVARLQRLDRSVTDNAWSDGLDFSLSGLLPQPAEGWQQTVATQLAEATDSVKQAQALFALNQYPRQTQVALARTVRALRRANEVLSGDGVPADTTTAPLRQAVAQKLDEAQAALLLAAGVELDALADQPFVAPGDALTVAGLAWWHPTCPLSATRLTLTAPVGWQVEAMTKVPRMEHGEAPAGQGWLVRVAAEAPPTQPSGLREARRGERYEVAEAALRGRPQSPPPLTVTLRCAIDDTIVSVSAAVQYRRA
ncbi:MAG: PIG-L family deacetylase, partial [Fimbriimonadaceae bacterium]|nr:PIG-L family deacetylase [Fimbriimonadaceae bacterium]